MTAPPPPATETRVPAGMREAWVGLGEAAVLLAFRGSASVRDTDSQSRKNAARTCVFVS